MTCTYCTQYFLWYFLLMPSLPLFLPHISKLFIGSIYYTLFILLILFILYKSLLFIFFFLKIYFYTSIHKISALCCSLTLNCICCLSTLCKENKVVSTLKMSLYYFTIIQRNKIENIHLKVLLSLGRSLSRSIFVQEGKLKHSVGVLTDKHWQNVSVLK